jgi:hypothetical protein
MFIASIAFPSFLSHLFSSLPSFLSLLFSSLPSFLSLLFSSLPSFYSFLSFLLSSFSYLTYSLSYFSPPFSSFLSLPPIHPSYLILTRPQFLSLHLPSLSSCPLFISFNLFILFVTLQSSLIYSVLFYSHNHLSSILFNSHLICPSSSHLTQCLSPHIFFQLSSFLSTACCSI